MTLPNRGRDTLRVQPKKVSGRDPYGVDILVDDGDPVDWKCAMQPLSSTETYEAGLQVSTGYRAIGPNTWPGGVHSDITWVERGTRFSQLGFPAVRTQGRRTHHTTVTLQQIGGQVR